MIVISAENQKIKHAVRLSRDSALRRAENSFIVEGARLCSDAAEAGVVIHELYVTDAAANKYASYLERIIKNKTVNAYQITQIVSQKLSDTKTPQGIFCVCDGLDNFRKIDKIVCDGKILLLENLQDPSNIGAIIRTAAALGVDAVVLSGGCDIYNPKLLRASMGAVFRQKLFYTDDVCSFITRCNNEGIKTYASVLSDDSVTIDETDFSGNTVVIVGNEGNGISPECAALCQKRFSIPMSGGVESLNAAMAAGIMIWKLSNH